MTKVDSSGSEPPGFEEEAAHFVDDPPELAAATARGLADIAAGRTIPHAEVKEWLLKLAQGERAPRPRPRKPLGQG